MIEDLNTKEELLRFVVESLEAEPLPMSAVSGLQTAIEPGKWNPITLLNGWANLGGAWAGASWRTVVGSLIQLRGSISHATETGPVIICQLPVKPKEWLTLGTISNGGTATYLALDNVGNLSLQAPALPAGSWMSLNDIFFGSAGT